MREYQQNNNIIPDSWLKYILFYAVSFAFIFLNAYLVLKKDTLLGILIPFALVIVLTAIYSYDKLIWVVVFCAPFSIPLKELVPGLPFDMFLPTEPLLFGILIVFLLTLLNGKKIDRSIIRHPVAIVLYFYLGWIAVTSCFSCLPLVSFKFMLTRIWYIVPFFFLFVFLFKDSKNIEKLILITKECY